MEEYVKSRPSSIHKLWFDFRKKNSNSASKRGKVVGAAGDGDGLISGGGSSGGDDFADDLEFYNDDADGGTGGDVSGSGSAGGAYSMDRKSDQTDDTDPGKAFGDWLPTWYEAVLLLLSEERRRAHAVFGADLAPEIIVKVLNECFRPILSSFQARLSAICPSDGSTRIGGSPGSFEAICRAYDATLQFLSVAYEQVVDFDSPIVTSSHSMGSDSGIRTKGGDDDADQKSGIPSRTKTPVQLHMMTRSIFVSIASPFAPYQKHYAKLEDYHCGMAARMVSTDIRTAVSGRIMSLSDLQDSVERLAGLAPFMFPLAQGRQTNHLLHRLNELFFVRGQVWSTNMYYLTFFYKASFHGTNHSMVVTTLKVLWIAWTRCYQGTLANYPFHSTHCLPTS